MSTLADFTVEALTAIIERAMLSHIFVKHAQLRRMDPHGMLYCAQIYQIYIISSRRGFAPALHFGSLA
jgi:hypothetical protein